MENVETLIYLLLGLPLLAAPIRFCWRVSKTCATGKPCCWVW